jgi:NitT/TauT family transport system ATP-binding protein
MNAASPTLVSEPAQLDQGSRSLVVLRGVEKRFRNGTLALRGLDLAIEPGSFVSLLGASGCGKSTVLRIIAGLVSPSAGTVDWPPAESGPAAGRAPRISFVFQDPTLMPWATAIDNVRLPLDLSHVPKAEARARARAALASVGLEAFERSYPRELSGGMRMRVSIARAIVTRPNLLLLDEPFAALDEITRFRLNNDLAGLWRSEKFTAIFVTHSVFESVYLSQRVVVMAARPGRVSADVSLGLAGERNEAFRTSPAYAELCRTTAEALSRAMSQ